MADRVGGGAGPRGRAGGGRVLADPGAGVGVDGYNTAHGHGPTWRELVSEASLWPADLPMMERHRVVPALWRAGYVDGAQTPFGLRARTPGQRAAFLKGRENRARTAAAAAGEPISAP